jgi:hypothetical protein
MLQARLCKSGKKDVKALIAISKPSFVSTLQISIFLLTAWSQFNVIVLLIFFSPVFRT